MCTRDENAAWLQKSRQEKRWVASALVLQAINSNKANYGDSALKQFARSPGALSPDIGRH
jgi:hypothetical protein